MSDHTWGRTVFSIWTLFVVSFATIAGCAVISPPAAPVLHTTTTTKPPCDPAVDVITVWRDDPTPCDVTPPQWIDVVGVTLEECDDMGGEWIGDGIDICHRVGY